MKSLFFVLILFSFTQCSIEKRLYRPGWHVTWKNKSHHRADIGNEKTLSANNENSTFKSNTLVKDALIENVPLSDTSNVAAHLPVAHQTKHPAAVAHHAPNSISHATTDMLFSEKGVTVVPNPNSKNDDAYQKNWGVVILFVGIICLIIAGLFIMAALSSSFLEVIVFLIGAYFFGIVGLGLVLIGFVISLAILAQNNRLKRKKEVDRLFDNSPRAEREATELQKENSSTTEREETDSERKDLSKLKSGILFAAAGAFLIGLFLLFN